MKLTEVSNRNKFFIMASIEELLHQNAQDFFKGNDLPDYEDIDMWKDQAFNVVEHKLHGMSYVARETYAEMVHEMIENIADYYKQLVSDKNQEYAMDDMAGND